MIAHINKVEVDLARAEKARLKGDRVEWAKQTFNFLKLDCLRLSPGCTVLGGETSFVIGKKYRIVICHDTGAVMVSTAEVGKIYTIEMENELRKRIIDILAEMPE